MLNNSNFYPTPKNVITQMLNKLKNGSPHSILEPSAGKGDILEEISLFYEHLRGRMPKLYCIEKDRELRSCLLGKEFTVIDSDFLTYTGRIQFDVILMNPPFDDGAKHLLKAWEILYNGEIVCLLNKETYLNPYTKERQLLKQIIDNNGTIDDLGKCFIEAERPTDVEVIMVYLSKNNQVETDHFTNLAQKEASSHVISNIPENMLETRDIIHNAVLDYNNAIDVTLQAFIKIQEADYYVKRVQNSDYNNMLKDHLKSLIEFYSRTTYTDNLSITTNKFLMDLRKTAWENIVNKGKFKKYMTDNVLKEFNAKIHLLSKSEFTESNIYQLILNLVKDHSSNLEKAMLEVFDHMCSYYNDNKLYYEGWKSNSCYKVNKKVVLPYFISYDKLMSRLPYRLNWHYQDKLNDIDRVISLLDGGNQMYISISKALDDVFHVNPHAKQTESTYFNIKYFQKGTIHLTFKCEQLWQRFNTKVGQIRQWLPPDIE